MRLVTDHSSPYHRRFRSRGRNVSVLQEPRRIFPMLKEFEGWTKERHVRESLLWSARGVLMERMLADAIDAALKTYGHEGSLISGAIRDHFPSVVKDALRSLAVEKQFCVEASLAHHEASGKRRTTWFPELTRDRSLPSYELCERMALINRLNREETNG